MLALAGGAAPARGDVTLGVDVQNVGAPSVAILGPREGRRLRAGLPVAIRARAERSARLHLAVDGRLLGSSARASIYFLWTPSPGPHTIVALAQAPDAPDALASVQVTALKPARRRPAARCSTAARRRTPACRCRTRAATRTAACRCRTPAATRTRSRACGCRTPAARPRRTADHRAPRVGGRADAHARPRPRTGACRTARRPVPRRSAAVGSLGGALGRLPAAPPAAAPGRVLSS